MSRFESPWAASWAIGSSWAVSWSRGVAPAAGLPGGPEFPAGLVAPGRAAHGVEGVPGLAQRPARAATRRDAGSRDVTGRRFDLFHPRSRLAGPPGVQRRFGQVADEPASHCVYVSQPEAVATLIAQAAAAATDR
jgi:hypothetical protein